MPTRKEKSKGIVTDNAVTTVKGKVKDGKAKFKKSSISFGDGSFTTTNKKTITKKGSTSSREKEKFYAYNESTGKSKNLIKTVTRTKDSGTRTKNIFKGTQGKRTKIKE